MIYIYISCITFRALSMGKYGIFLDLLGEMQKFYDINRINDTKNQ